MAKLTEDERYFLGRIRAGWKADLPTDKAMKGRMQRRGLVVFKRREWRWVVTNEGRAALSQPAGGEGI